MVVVGSLAEDVRVFARREIQPLEPTERREDFEGAKDRGPPNAKVSRVSVHDQVARGEVAITIRDERRQRPARFREPIAGALERCDQVLCVHERILA